MLPCHNARIKRYPDGSAELMIGSRPFGGGNVNLPSWADDGEPPFIRDIMESAEERMEREYACMERDAIALDDDVYDLGINAAACRAAAVRRSARRARKAVKDIARSNEWAYFVTLTLDKEKVDRYDFAAIWRHLRHWLGNNVRRKGLAYVLVPERHKDGAFHFHGLFNDALEAVDSGTMSIPGRKAPVRVRSEDQRQEYERMGGHAVYNLPGWGWGFSTAIRLYGEREAAINYVCKYIGKEMGGNVSRETFVPEKIGGRWYYSGGALARPVVEWFDVDLRDYEGMPGWYCSEAYPYASFLTMRITADGEVLPPYSSVTVPDAEHDRGGDQPSERGVTIAPVPSSGHADDVPVTGESRESCAAVGPGTRAALTASRPARNLPDFSHLTDLGLSNSHGPPGAQALRALDSGNDP